MTYSIQSLLTPLDSKYRTISSSSAWLRWKILSPAFTITTPRNSPFTCTDFNHSTKLLTASSFPLDIKISFAIRGYDSALCFNHLENQTQEFKIEIPHRQHINKQPMGMIIPKVIKNGLWPRFEPQHQGLWSNCDCNCNHIGHIYPQFPPNNKDHDKTTTATTI